MAHDRNALDVLVDHQGNYLGERLLGRDAQNLAGHDVTHPASTVGGAWLGLAGPGTEHDRGKEVAEKLAIAEHPKEASLVVDDGEGAEAGLHHRDRGLSQRGVGPRDAWPLGHEIANRERVLQLDIRQARQSSESLGIGLTQHLVDDLVAGQRPRDATDELQVAGCLPGRRYDQRDDAGPLRFAVSKLPLHGFNSGADRNADLACGVRSTVEHEGPVSQRDRVLGSVLGYPLEQPLGVGEDPRRRQSIGEDGRRLGERTRAQGDLSKRRCQKLAESHAVRPERPRASEEDR